ncbi:hypothetical protein ABZ864_01605 [Streptomyces sp. NPDC047082]|uniref:hypothetical protein n=1 Tax=Streptomyces sp. NPDC047082 TaxID=3155259 RepID=UPI0033E2B8D4
MRRHLVASAGWDLAAVEGSMPLNAVGYAGSLMPITVGSFLLMAVAFGGPGR